jgi:putative transposase
LRFCNLGCRAIESFPIRWLREELGGRQTGKMGRPRLTKSLRDLIIKLAKENLSWGVRRILGELKKLAVTPGSFLC